MGTPRTTLPLALTGLFFKYKKAEHFLMGYNILELVLFNTNSSRIFRNLTRILLESSYWEIIIQLEFRNGYPP